MKAYEGLFLFAPESTPDMRKKQEQGVEDAVKKFGGKVTAKVELGKRGLAHELRKSKEALFINFEIEIDPENVEELRKTLELQTDVWKYMLTVKLENPHTKLPTQSPAGHKAPEVSSAAPAKA